MKQHTFEAFSITEICWTPLLLMSTAMPPRDPDEEDEEEDEEDEDEEGEDDADEPAIVRASRTKIRLVRVRQSAL